MQTDNRQQTKSTNIFDQRSVSTVTADSDQTKKSGCRPLTVPPDLTHAELILENIWLFRFMAASAVLAETQMSLHVCQSKPLL